METFVAVLSAGVGAGLMAIVNTIINHKLKKEDKEDERITALVEAQKIILVDRIQWLGAKYIEEKKISLNNKRNLLMMHKAFKSLGGNGELDPVMEEIEKLPVEV